MADEILITVRVRDETREPMERVRKQSKDATEDIKKGWKDAGAVMAGMLGAEMVTAGAAKMRDFAASSVEAASSLNESMNAVTKVFGASTGAITKFGETAASTVGLSQAEFQGLSVEIGSGLKNAGLSMQDTSKWTIDLTKRASDMASVFNTTVPDALEAIQAGLRGEADPLERYGVGLSAAAVQAEALAEHSGKTASQLTQQELATARLNLIMKQTASTQGDFASTSDEYANAQRVANAQIEDAKAKLGAGLLPVLAKTSQATAAMVTTFAGLPGPVQGGALAVAGLGTAFVVLAPRIAAAKELLGQARDGMTKLGTGALAADTKMGTFTRGVAKAGAAVAALQVAGALLASGTAAAGIDTTTRALQDLQRSGVDASGTLKALDKDLYKIGGADWEKNLERALEGLNPMVHSLKDTEERISAIDAALAQQVSSGNAEAAAAQFAILATKAKEQNTSVDTLRKSLPQYQNALDAAATATAHATSATTENTTALVKNAAQIEKDANALLGLRGSVDSYWASVDDATQALKDNGHTLDMHTEKGRANRSALDSVARSTWEWRNAAKEAGKSTAEQNRIMVRGRDELVRMATRFGMARKAARDYANAVLGIPERVTTTLTLNANVQGALNKLRGMGNAGAGGYAHGGVVGAAASGGVQGGMTLVGEQGPELVSLPSGSTVHTAGDTARMLGAGTGGGVPAVRLEFSDGEVERFLVSMLRRAVKSQGGNVQIVLGQRA